MPKETLPAPVIPPNIAELLGPASLLSSESKTDYHAMMASFAVDVDPKNFIEWVWVKDLTDFTWQIRRWRLFQTRFIEAAEQEQEEESMRRSMPMIAAHMNTTSSSRQGALGASQKPSRWEARYLASQLPILGELERLIGNAERRRRAIFDDLERYRFGLGQKLREKAAKAETIDITSKAQP